MSETEKTYSILQVEFANRSEGWLRKLMRGKETYHARLVLRDDETRAEVAELCFSAKNARGRTISHAIFRPVNALRAIADVFGMGDRFESKMNKTSMAADIPHLKGVLLLSDHRSCIQVRPEYPQEVRFTGSEDDVLLKMESLCNAAEKLNRSDIIFTSVGFRAAANNCRAGTKAVSEAADIEFAALHRRARLGADSTLSQKLALSAADIGKDGRSGDMHTRLEIMSARLRDSVRSIEPESAAEMQADYV